MNETEIEKMKEDHLMILGGLLANLYCFKSMGCTQEDLDINIGVISKYIQERRQN